MLIVTKPSELDSVLTKQIPVDADNSYVHPGIGMRLPNAVTVRVQEGEIILSRGLCTFRIKAEERNSFAFKNVTVGNQEIRYFFCSSDTFSMRWP